MTLPCSWGHISARPEPSSKPQMTTPADARMYLTIPSTLPSCPAKATSQNEVSFNCYIFEMKSLHISSKGLALPSFNQHSEINVFIFLFA